MSRPPSALISGERECAGLTLREVARRASVSPSFLHHVEHGRCTPSPETSDRIADALGLSRGVLRRSFADEEIANVRARWIR